MVAHSATCPHLIFLDRYLTDPGYRDGLDLANRERAEDVLSDAARRAWLLRQIRDDHAREAA